MIKLKDLLKEAPAKFSSVHLTSTFDTTFGRFYSNHIPLTTKFMQGVLGKERVSVFHIGNAEYADDVKNIARIVGKKSALSTFTKVDKGEKLAKGKGIQTGGGIIYQLEGSLLVASTRDMQTHPDKTGRRWVSPEYLAGKVAGMKMYNELKKGIKQNKIDRNVWYDIERKVRKKVEKETGYGDTNYDFQAWDKNVAKALGPYKQKWIKKYIDMCYKIMSKYKPQIKRHILRQKDKPSKFGWNEIIVNQIKVKDIFLLSRENYPSTRKAAEKLATGTVTVGSPAQYRKWFKERGGVINDSSWRD